MIFLNKNYFLYLYSTGISSYPTTKEPQPSQRIDDETYGLTQNLSSTPKEYSHLHSIDAKISQQLSGSAAAPPIKKSKFGLPGLAPMPSKSKDCKESVDDNIVPSISPVNWNKSHKIEVPRPKFGVPGMIVSATNNLSQISTHPNKFNASKAPKASHYEQTNSLKQDTFKSNCPSTEILRPREKINTDVSYNQQRPPFRTAHEQLVIDNQKRFGRNNRIGEANSQGGCDQRSNSSNLNHFNQIKLQYVFLQYSPTYELLNNHLAIPFVGQKINFFGFRYSTH